MNGVPYTYGSVHFSEVAFVFYNLEGLGYPQNGGPNPLGGPERPKYLVIAKLMTRMWISFTNYGDPNKNLGGEQHLYHELFWRLELMRRCSGSRELASLFTRRAPELCVRAERHLSCGA